MARDETPPFPRGSTYYNGGTIDSNNYGGVNLEGKEYRFEDTIYGTGQYVTVRVVRNSASFNLLPKRLVVFDTSSGNYPMRVNGYTSQTNQPGFPVDELLPAAGVPPGDLFYIVVQGPAAVLTDLAGGANNPVSVGDALVALTAATSGATTAGRVATISAASTNAPAAALGKVARACSAATTANTNYSLLAIVDRWL